MAGKALDVYLNDHLAGATLGTDLARQIEEQNAGTPLGDAMATVAQEVEEDRQTLLDLMERADTSKNPVKQATGWMAEKASRAKFSGLTSGEPELGTFMALESMSLGIEGKLSLWIALKEAAAEHAALASVDLDELIERARSQRSTVERERIAAARQALTGSGSVA